MWKHTKRAMPLIILISLVLTTNIAQAQLKATAVVYAWDHAVNKFQNSMVVLPFDGQWESFLHKLNFDDFPFLGDYPVGCTTPTQWAGEMEYGLYHVDNAPAGAEGFRETRNWQLVKCDRDNDGDFDNDDLYLGPQTLVTPYTGGEFLVLDIDVETPCTTGNCLTEIVTTFFVNIDSDCDGVPNSDIPAGGVCFYAEARTPTTSTPFWGTPLQARISAGGGDKTVNFRPEPYDEPSAITLASFSATSLGNVVLLAGIALIVAAVVVVFGLTRPSHRTSV